MTASEQRRRLQNLADVHAAVGSLTPCHSVQQYLPGQVVYNLGEYPARFSLAPTAYDAELLGRFAAAGVELIQLHEEWNDSQRLLGADKFTSHDPEGLRQFIALAHSLGLKVIPYISSGYFDTKDPDFREEFFDAERSRLVEMYFDYARCSPASPEWRAYLLSRVSTLLDEYEFDGLYNDVGYNAALEDRPVPEGQVRPAPWPHAAFEDLLGELYDLAHARGGLLKMHGGPAHVSDRMRVYDYLWMGEGVENLEQLRQDCRALPPYVVPCPDMSRAEVIDEDDLYRHTLPCMQFPLRVDGRPFTGARANVLGVHYQPAERCFWTRHCRAIEALSRTNPEGPHTYGWWDSCPGRPQAREIWLDYFRLYRPMVVPGSRVWREVRYSTIFGRTPPEHVTASLFVNTEIYLVLANYGTQRTEFISTWHWEDRRSGRHGTIWRLEPRQMLFLQRLMA